MVHHQKQFSHGTPQASKNGALFFVDEVQRHKHGGIYFFSAPQKRHTKMSANNLVQDFIHNMPDIAGPRMEFILPILLTNTPAWDSLST